jgi:hypothetical protein
VIQINSRPMLGHRLDLLADVLAKRREDAALRGTDAASAARLLEKPVVREVERRAQ